MNIKAVKTRIITSEDNDIFKILDDSIETLTENSVVAVTSKIISITEGSVLKIDDSVEKEELRRCPPKIDRLNRFGERKAANDRRPLSAPGRRSRSPACY